MRPFLVVPSIVAVLISSACSQDWSGSSDSGVDAGGDPDGSAAPGEEDGAMPTEEGGADASASDAATAADPCSPNPCGPVATCSPAEGAAGYTCACPPGFEKQGSACVDINECEARTDNCHATATCKNTDGSYQCECAQGLSGGGMDGIACSPTIALSQREVCGIRDDGAVVCAKSEVSPHVVEGLAAVAALDGGQDVFCALLRDRTVKCWGTSAIAGSAVPTRLEGLSEVVQFSTNGADLCAVRSDGTLWCQGGNPGVEISAPQVTPVKVAGIRGASWVSVGMGGTCVTMRDGSAQCWGPKLPLGNGAADPSLLPVPVKGVANALTVDAGYVGACIRRLDGGLSCWGISSSTSSESSAALMPTPLEGTEATSSYAAGLYSSCFTNRQGLSCWYFQNKPLSVAAGALSAVMQLNDVCALMADGVVKCWEIETPGRPQYASYDLW